MKAYAGIGSRETPDDVQELMAQTAKRLAWRGWTLRSGGADGADHAFEVGHRAANSAGAKTPLEIYLPWPSFNAELRDSTFGFERRYTESHGPAPAAERIASFIHPAWDRLGQGARKLHARNVHQILGRNIEDASAVVRFVICWTKDAAGGGGTGQALRLAKQHNVPIFDLADADARRRIESWLA